MAAKGLARSPDTSASVPIGASRLRGMVGPIQQHGERSFKAQRPTVCCSLELSRSASPVKDNPRERSRSPKRDRGCMMPGTIENPTVSTVAVLCQDVGADVPRQVRPPQHCHLFSSRTV